MNFYRIDWNVISKMILKQDKQQMRKILRVLNSKFYDKLKQMGIVILKNQVGIKQQDESQIGVKVRYGKVKDKSVMKEYDEGIKQLMKVAEGFKQKTNGHNESSQTVVSPLIKIMRVREKTPGLGPKSSRFMGKRAVCENVVRRLYPYFEEPSAK